MFIADDDWTELTAGGAPAVRFSAPDLQQAQRVRRRLAGECVLDVTVVVDDDFRSAQRLLSELEVGQDTLAYAGTLDGLAGLLADIYLAGVADGVTLIPAAPQQDARSLAEAASQRVALRLRIAA
ncbi:hypothetical protein BVC93_09765 [Mycobacterium sp. MS1601]|nr:hypothetical protein [Mycobacterium sp. MS1601]AQA02674.1 hypothetical protein BVC93_09765 [Mycobacterium sp. MS1601]